MRAAGVRKLRQSVRLPLGFAIRQFGQTTSPVGVEKRLTKATHGSGCALTSANGRLLCILCCWPFAWLQRSRRVDSSFVNARKRGRVNLHFREESLFSPSLTEHLQAHGAHSHQKASASRPCKPVSSHTWLSFPCYNYLFELPPLPQRSLLKANCSSTRVWVAWRDAYQTPRRFMTIKRPLQRLLPRMQRDSQKPWIRQDCVAKIR